MESLLLARSAAMSTSELGSLLGVILQRTSIHLEMGTVTSVITWDQSHFRFVGRPFKREGRNEK